VLKVFKELQVRLVVQVQLDLLERTLPLRVQQGLQEPQERLEQQVVLEVQVQQVRLAHKAYRALQDPLVQLVQTPQFQVLRVHLDQLDLQVLLDLRDQLEILDQQVQQEKLGLLVIQDPQDQLVLQEILVLQDLMVLVLVYLGYIQIRVQLHQVRIK
jgi:hypothetical protein